jgi:hypothetical protein
MLVGLTILAFNFQSLFEIGVLYALFGWWEKSSMIILVRKNLIAHKKRNKLTSLIYALTLGSTIFLIVATNLVVSVINSNI